MTSPLTPLHLERGNVDWEVGMNQGILFYHSNDLSIQSFFCRYDKCWEQLNVPY